MFNVHVHIMYMYNVHCTYFIRILYILCIFLCVHIILLVFCGHVCVRVNIYIYMSMLYIYIYSSPASSKLRRVHNIIYSMYICVCGMCACDCVHMTVCVCLCVCVVCVCACVVCVYIS